MRGPFEDPMFALHEQLVEILSRLMDSDVVNSADLTILCLGCGVRTSEICQPLEVE